MVFIITLISLLVLPAAIGAKDIAYLYNGNLWLTDAAFSSHQALLDTTRNWMTNLKWSPDGRRLGFISEKGLEVYDFDDSTVHNFGDYDRTNYLNSSSSFDWSPDGTHLVAWKSDSLNNRRLYRLPYHHPGDAVLLTPGDSVKATVSYWSPRGDRILYHDSKTMTARIITLDGDTVMSRTCRAVFGWTYDGSYMIVTTDSGYNQLLAVNATNRNAVVLDDSTISTWGNGSPSISPNANEVAYTRFMQVEGINGTEGYYEARVAAINGTNEGFGWRKGTSNTYAYFTLNPQWSSAGDRCVLIDWDAGNVSSNRVSNGVVVGMPGDTTVYNVDGGGATGSWSNDDKDILLLSPYRSPMVLHVGTGAVDTAVVHFVTAKWRPQQTFAISVSDGNPAKQALANQELYLIRVSGDAPNQAEDTLGIVKTDSNGKIQLTPVP